MRAAGCNHQTTTGVEMTARTRLILVLMALAAAAGCGNDASAPGSTARQSDIVVEVGSAEVPVAKRATLRIDGSGVTHGTGFLAPPAAAGAAASALGRADAVKRLVEGPPPDQMCTEIYGGPDAARVTGRIEGSAVDATISRSDGCGIADWDLLLSLVGPPLWGGDSTAGYGDRMHPIEATVGDTFTIVLESNPSTGYEWAIDVPAGSVRVAGSTFEAPPSDLVGAAGHQIFQLQAVAPDVVDLRFVYRRPWEPDVEPVHTRTFTVEIRNPA